MFFLFFPSLFECHVSHTVSLLFLTTSPCFSPHTPVSQGLLSHLGSENFPQHVICFFFLLDKAHKMKPGPEKMLQLKQAKHTQGQVQPTCMFGGRSKKLGPNVCSCTFIPVRCRTFTDLRAWLRTYRRTLKPFYCIARWFVLAAETYVSISISWTHLDNS